MSEICFGHEVPPFRDVFAKLFKAGVQVMSLPQIKEVAAELSTQARASLAGYLGEQAIAHALEGLPSDTVEFLTSTYTGTDPVSDEDFAKQYPLVMTTINNKLSAEQLQKVLAKLSAEDMASQSFFLGDEGRAHVFSKMRPEAVRAILDHTQDWVFIETGRRAIGRIRHYEATLEKNERVGGKLQGTETIAIKVQHKPLAIYMKWLAGPFKGRELLYNELVLGAGKLRVREGGLLGIVPVTIGLDSPVAQRGTNHKVTEVGVLHLVNLIERDYRRAAPAGHIERINHGIVKLDGVPVYKMETVLPRDRSLGYYCYRMIHYTDYVRGMEVKSEIFNFDNDLQETYYYKDLNTAARLTERDFDPANPSYKL